MSGKSKVKLTENGVADLYDHHSKKPIIAQVIFLTGSEKFRYLRLSDGQCVSPVLYMWEADLKKSFDVGDVLAVQEVKIGCIPLETNSNFINFDLEDNMYPEEGMEEHGGHQLGMEDVGIHPVYLKRYSILAAAPTLGKFLGNPDHSTLYWDDLKYVQEILRKFDAKYDAYIKLERKTYKQRKADGEHAREKGNFYFNKKDYNQAIIHYDIAKKKDPYDHRVWCNCSQAHFKFEEYDVAQVNAVVAIKLNPFNPKAYHRAAQAANKYPNNEKNELARSYLRMGLYACGNNNDLQQLLQEVNNNPVNHSGCTVQQLNNNKKEHNNKSSNAAGKSHHHHDCVCDKEVPNSTSNKKSSNKRKEVKEDKSFFEETKTKSKKDKVSEEKGEKDKQKQTKADNQLKEEKKKAEAKVEERPKPRNAYQENLFEGRKLFEEENYTKAVLIFIKNLATLNTEDLGMPSVHREVQILQFISGMCKIHLGGEQAMEGMEMMKTLLETSFPNHPACHYYLATGYVKIMLYKMKDHHCYNCESLLKKADTPVTAIKWPGSDDSIPITVRTNLEKQNPALWDTFKSPMEPPEAEAIQLWKRLPINEQFKPSLDSAYDFYDKYKHMEKFVEISICRTSRGIFHLNLASKGSAEASLFGRSNVARPTPKARCRFKDCLKAQGHDYAKEEIYVTDPEFRGFLDVMCEEYCTISYHPCCWKSHKETLENSLGRLSDKDFLGTDCITPDCSGKICTILIYDEMGKLKLELSKDKKDKKNLIAPVKQKKKKDKKKEKAQVNKNEKKKVKQESVCEDSLPHEETPHKADDADKAKDNAKNEKNIEKGKSPAAVSNLPIDVESLASSRVTILKPPTKELDQTPEGEATKKKNKKKNKKQKAVHIDLLVDPLEVELDSEESVQNEYIARLRQLRWQRQAQEEGLSPVGKAPPMLSARELPATQILQLLDPDNPFYLPEHLRDNPAALEQVLQRKAVTSTSPGIDSKAVETLLDFTYDWLKEEGPMSVNDPSLHDFVSDNYPPEARAHVNNVGSIKTFLMSSINFAMIDDMIGVRDHVVRAQDSVRQAILEKMSSSRYLISDGHRAKKFSHLLDDDKSTCSSSTSSVSLLSLQASSTVSSSAPTQPFPAFPCTFPGISPSPLFPPPTILNRTKNKPATEKGKGRILGDGGLADLDVFEIVTNATNNVLPRLNPTAAVFEPLTANEEEEVEQLDRLTRLGTGMRMSESSLGEEGNPEEVLFPCVENEEEEKEEEEDEDVGFKEQMEQLQRQVEQEQTHVQKLNDKLVQVKSQLGLEINTLKQKLRDLSEQKQSLQSERDSQASARDGEAKKLRIELSRMADEKRILEIRHDKLEGQYELANDRANNMEAKLMEEQEVTKQLREDQANLEQSLSSSSRRAHEAEVKYLCTKKDLGEAYLSRTIERLSEEVTHMRKLLLSATDETTPDRATVKRSVVAWDENIKALRDKKRSFLEDGNRMWGIIKAGRPLSVLPTGDLAVPNIPNISVGPLLCLGQKSHGKAVPLLPLVDQLEQGRFSPSSPVQSSGKPKGLLPTPIGPLASSMALPNTLAGGPLTSPLAGGIPSPLPPNLYLPNGVPSMPPLGGAKPKRAPSIPELKPSQSWPESHQLYVEQIPWDYTEADVKPVAVGNHILTLKEPKEVKAAGKPTSLALGSLAESPGGSRAGLGIGGATMNGGGIGGAAMNGGGIGGVAMNGGSSMNGGGIGLLGSPPGLGGGSPIGVSSFGLSDISINANAEANKANARGSPLTPPTPLHASTTITTTKPKFQNLTSNNSVGAIGTLPPKPTRPVPRQTTSNSKSSTITVSREDAITSTASYKRLIEICKQRVGKEFASPEVCNALKEVRLANNKSLTGMTVEKIAEKVEVHLRSQRRPGSGQAKATMAPWASLTQGGGKANGGAPSWHGPEEGSAPEEQCSICLEALEASPTQQLQCQHVFHEKCIKDWLKRQSNCPNCRTFTLMTDEYPTLSH